MSLLRVLGGQKRGEVKTHTQTTPTPIHQNNATTYKANHVHTKLRQVHLCKGARAVESVEAHAIARGSDNSADLRDAIKHRLACANVVGSTHTEKRGGDSIRAGGAPVPVVDTRSIGVGLARAKNDGDTPSTTLDEACHVDGADDCVCVGGGVWVYECE